MHPLILSMLLAFISGMAHAAIYKWVDAQGVTHYTQLPPPSGQGEEISPKTLQPSTAPAPKVEPAPQVSEEPSEKPKEVFTIPAEQLQQQCEQARQRLQQLESSPRILTRGDDGQMQRVPEEERQRMIDEERQRIQLYCD